MEENLDQNGSGMSLSEMMEKAEKLILSVPVSDFSIDVLFGGNFRCEIKNKIVFFRKHKDTIDLNGSRDTFDLCIDGFNFVLTTTNEIKNKYNEIEKILSAERNKRIDDEANAWRQRRQEVLDALLK